MYRVGLYTEQQKRPRIAERPERKFLTDTKIVTAEASVLLLFISVVPLLLASEAIASQR